MSVQLIRLEDASDWPLFAMVAGRVNAVTFLAHRSPSQTLDAALSEAIQSFTGSLAGCQDQGAISLLELDYPVDVRQSLVAHQVAKRFRELSQQEDVAVWDLSGSQDFVQIATLLQVDEGQILEAIARTREDSNGQAVIYLCSGPSGGEATIIAREAAVDDRRTTHRALLRAAVRSLQPGQIVAQAFGSFDDSEVGVQMFSVDDTARRVVEHLVPRP